MTWADDVRRANEALDWIEARQGPLPESGYARIETDVRTVRAMAEGQDADERVQEIRARVEAATTDVVDELAGFRDFDGEWTANKTHRRRASPGGVRETFYAAGRISGLAEGDSAHADIAYLLARLDALTAERDTLLARAERAEAALRRSRLWLEGAEETFSASSDCGEDEDADCVRGDSYCERARDMRQGIAEIDAALAASSAEPDECAGHTHEPGARQRRGVPGLVTRRDRAESSDALRARAERAETALPDPGKLWSLATWLDGIYPNDAKPEVQDDLRAWALRIHALGLHPDSWVVKVEEGAPPASEGA